MPVPIRTHTASVDPEPPTFEAGMSVETVRTDGSKTGSLGEIESVNEAREYALVDFGMLGVKKMKFDWIEPIGVD